MMIFRKNYKDYFRNKDFVKYFSAGLVLIILISPLFLDRFGKFIPSIMQYFIGTKAKNLTSADQYIVNLGYFGSFLAGTLGLIFGFVSLLFLILTFLNQSRKNEISEIENRIFKLIELLVEIKNKNELSINSQKFLDDNKSISNLENLKNKLTINHLQFSNFFRMLYQILKYIYEHEDIIHNKYCKKELDTQVKSYTNIIRSYLDTNLLTCLAINCYCLPSENGEYSHYKYLLERYELLEHLPNNLLMQFSSYLYYDKKAFGNSTWFRDFDSIRNDLIEISISKNTKDFCEVFLYFLSKNNGKWKNERAILEIHFDTNKNIFELYISGINNKEIPERLKFIIEKYTSSENLNLSNYPFNLSCDDFKAQILKDGNKLKLSYLKPDNMHTFANEVNITLLILTLDQLEMEFNITSETCCILPF